ncbi:MAG: YcxB family protein [Oscillospiraceae bacterium]|nr:YcxB family protein [Oscillospiraceae bacterium]
MCHDSDIKLSVLVTREEYCEAVAHEKRKSRRHIVPLFNVISAVLIILGFAGLFFGDNISLSPAAAFCLILSGLVAACYDGIFAPVFDKAAAAREFNEKPDLHYATTYTIKDDLIVIKNEWVQGKISISQLTRWSETPTLFIMAVGRELSISIPKRLLTPEQQNKLRQILHTDSGGSKTI